MILAHFYTRPEVQEVADFLGDSLALSQKACKMEAPVILFAGVNFMAETAKVLAPEKTILVPNPEAGCSLADSCNAEEFRRYLTLHPCHTVVSYVNTTVEVKALTDVCCTSSNAIKVVESIDKRIPVLFGPDHNLGRFVMKRANRDNILLWQGGCHVHERFRLEAIEELRKLHPSAEVMVHPECRPEVQDAAHFVGSTSDIIDYCRRSSQREFIIVTEAGILATLRREMPDKEFIPVPSSDGSPLNECEYMKMVTLESIARCLEEMSPAVTIDEEVRKAAERSIVSMVNIGR